MQFWFSIEASRWSLTGKLRVSGENAPGHELRSDFYLPYCYIGCLTERKHIFWNYILLNIAYEVVCKVEALFDQANAILNVKMGLNIVN